MAERKKAACEGVGGLERARVGRRSPASVTRFARTPRELHLIRWRARTQARTQARTRVRGGAIIARIRARVARALRITTRTPFELCRLTALSSFQRGVPEDLGLFPFVERPISFSRSLLAHIPWAQLYFSLSLFSSRSRRFCFPCAAPFQASALALQINYTRHSVSLCLYDIRYSSGLPPSVRSFDPGSSPRERSC
jgi:hypothetical protein